MLSKYQCPFGPNFILGLSPAAWYRADSGVTVTGSGVSTLADLSGNGRDLLQSTDASRPPYLAYSGTKYLYLPGVAGNYATTPWASTPSITGDIDIRVRVALDDWTPAATSMLASKFGNDGVRSYYLAVTATGALISEFSGDGTAATAYTSTAVTGFTDGTTHWVRVTHNSTTGAALFYTSDDTTNDPAAVSWTQLGNSVAGAVTTIFDGSAPVEVGSRLAGAFGIAAGKFYRAIVKNGIDGTTVVDFNPDLDASDGSTSFASSATGETWTINSSGGLPAQIVGSPRLLADGTADAMATANFTLDQACSGILVVKALSWTAGDYLLSGTVAEAGLTQVTATPQVGLNAGAAAAANSGLTLGAWKVVYYEFNGASSKLKVGSAAATTGNAGANNPGGLALFRNQAGTAFGNAMLREWIVFNGALGDDQITMAMNYASSRWGVAL